MKAPGSENETTMVTQGVPDRDQELAAMRVLVDEVLEVAATGGADAAEVSASMHSGLSATVRLGEVETLEHHRDRGVAVTVFIGRSRGHATSADLQADSIRRCVSRALDIARFTQEDRCNGLADPGRLATHFPDLDLWHPRAMNPEEAIQRALACESAGLEDARVTNSEGASVSAHVGAAVYGNSHGFRGESSGTRYDQSCVLVAGQGGGMQRDYWYDSRRAFEDLEAVELTGRKAAERAVRRLESRKIATCEVPVLFAPEVARSLVGHFVGAVSGRALYQNASFLKDTLGERLFPGWLSIRELPFLPRGPGSTAFDAEGVATRERDLIDHGVLTGYVLASYAARRLGLETTGNAGGIHNLRVRGDVQAQADLIRQMGRGLLVTEVMGQGVNLITGDYSRGACGFWIEDGAISHPVEEVTVAGNLRDMFATIQALGDDLDQRGAIQSGSLLIGRMTVAGA